MAKQSTSKQAIERIDPETGEILSDGKDLQPFSASGSLEIPTDAQDLLDKYAGAGYSSSPEDGLTPILSILQDNSGEVKERHDRHLPGAKPGMLIIRSRRMLFPGEEGILVQPFGFNHVYVEWLGDPGEGIPVGRFLFTDPPSDMIEKPDPKDKDRRIKVREGSGNRLVDTREHLANLVTGVDSPFPVVIAMSGSNHGTSRQWTEMMRNMVYQGKRLPAFFRLYNLKTMFRKRGAYSWYSYHVDPAAFVKDRELLTFGAESFDMAKEKPLEGNLADLGGELDEQPIVASHASVNPRTVERASEHI